jgi:hypothetical protein
LCLTAGLIPFVRAAAQAPDTVIVARDVKIGMRKGVPLRATIYRPSGKTPHPAVLSIEADTGAARDSAARALAAAGFAVVVAAPRTGGAQNTERDGYDAIEWISDQSWSDRRIVMAGTNEGADAAWSAARERPPHLAAIFARTPTHALGWTRAELARTSVSALSVAGSAETSQGAAITADSEYTSVDRAGGPPAAYIVIGTMPDPQLALLEREWFDWAVGSRQLPTMLRNRVNYFVSTDSTWRAASSFAEIRAAPTSFPLHSNAGPRNAPGGFLGDAARDDEPADTVAAGGKEYKTLLGVPLDLAGRPTVTLWLDRAPQTGMIVALDEVLADGGTVSLGQSAGRLIPADTAAPKSAQRKWEFAAFPWVARRLVPGSAIRLTVRAEGAVVYHDTDRYSRVILPVVRGQR